MKPFHEARKVLAAARSELAPSGILRAGLNLANSTTVTQDVQTGELRGVAVDLSRALADALGVAFEPVSYASAGRLVEAASSGNWDIAFMAIDPARAREIAFTAPYMEVHNTYMVLSGSSIHTIADVDRPGVQVAVQERNALDLFLSRNLQHATLVRSASEDTALELLRSGRVHVLATGLGLLLAHAARWPGARVLEGQVLAVKHGIGVSLGRDNGLAFLRDFVEQEKHTGRVQQMLDRQGCAGVFVSSSSGP
jgi:polar amino acid transport system substrate-binding protein